MKNKALVFVILAFGILLNANNMKAQSGKPRLMKN